MKPESNAPTNSAEAIDSSLAKLLAGLEAAAADKLRSVVLYGSAAAGDYVGKRSDYNVLVVTTDLGQETLAACSKSARAWQKAGNPAPLLFTEERLRRSADVFPIELLDIKECHRILFGEDLVAGIEVDTANLRLEIEHELRGKLIQLRQRYLAAAGRNRQVADLMIESVGTFLVLFRAALRLFEREVPTRKIDALDMLDRHIECDLGVFKTVHALKAGDLKIKDLNVEDLFGSYLAAVESVIDEVDEYIQTGEKI